jgi:hypothetical protein
MCCCGCTLASAFVESGVTAPAGSDLPAEAAKLEVVAVVPLNGIDELCAPAGIALLERLFGWIMWPAHKAMRATASAQGSTNG